MGAQSPLAAQRPWLGAQVRQGTLSFDGKSTLGDFTGTTAEVHGQMTGGAAVTDVRGWIEAPVRSLKTGNDRRDRDLVKTMDTEIYPNIRFELGGLTVEWARGDSTGVLLDGNFVIHGVTRPEKVRGTVVRVNDGVHLTASLPMNLHDYRINRLTRFLVLKMDPNIAVHVDLVF